MSFLSAVAVGGITLGVGALIVALAGLSGLQEALRAEVLSRTSEIEIEGPVGELGALRPLIEGLAEVQSVTRRLRGAGWLLVGGSVRPVELVGYEGSLPESFPAPTGLGPGVYVSARLARLYGLEPGESLELASARSTLSPMGPVPRIRRVRLAGTFDGGSLEHRERVALPLESALGLLGAGRLHLVVSTGNLDTALRVADRLEGQLPPEVRMHTWRDLNAPLLLALELEKRLMFVAVFLIVMVGALALVSDLSLIISSRRSEIAILGTMGATPGSLRLSFLTLGVLLASLGVSLGVALGAGTARVLDRLEMVRLPGDAYLLDHVPFRLELPDLLWVVGATLVVAVASAWYGATRASALRLVEALSS